MALFKRRHFRAVLLEWLAYGMAFGTIAIVGACQAQLDEQTNASVALSTDSEMPVSEMPANVESTDFESADAEPTDAESADAEPTDLETADSESITPLPEPEFSDAVRADYRPVELASRSAEPLFGEDPVAIATGLLAAKEPMEGNYSESSEAEMGNERAVVLFTQENLPDDSVQAIRTRAEFERIDGPWQLIWAGEQYRCREGRGQQDWATALCG